MTGFRRSVVALTVLIATAVVAILVVVSHVLLSRVTDADAHDLARTRAEAVAANVTAKGGRVVLTENGSEALDEVAWVYADGRLIDGNVPASVVRRVEELADSRRSQTATAGDSSCTRGRSRSTATTSWWSSGWTSRLMRRPSSAV